jgi:rod shape-determining protein MreB
MSVTRHSFALALARTADFRDSVSAACALLAQRRQSGAAEGECHGPAPIGRKEERMKLRLPAGVFANDIGIDLGTANTLIYVRGEGVVVSEPSIVAMDRGRNAVIAVGQAAKAMLGRTPGSIDVVRPLRSGVIADFEVAQTMLRELIERVQPRGRLFRPRVVIGVSSCTTQVEKRAVREAALQAGAQAVYLVEEPMAAAIGAGIPIQEPSGHLIVDIGGGTTEVAVISLSGIVYCQSVRSGGDDMNDSITQYLKKHYNLLVGERRVEEFKLALGAARPTGEGPRTLQVKGSDIVARVPKTITINEDEVREALYDAVGTIVETVRVCLERIPPEIAADMVDNGIVLTGGGALLAGLDDIIRKELYLPVTIAPDPLSCVARGIGVLLDDLPLLKRVALEH